MSARLWLFVGLAALSVALLLIDLADGRLDEEYARGFGGITGSYLPIASGLLFAGLALYERRRRTPSN